MTYIDAIVSVWEINRERTLALIGELRGESDPQAAISWQPGAGRAHIGWQLTHIAVTEELFAKERLIENKAGFADLIARFGKESKPDSNVPALDEIVETLSATREHLLETVRSLSDDDLQTIPAGLQPRGWTVQKALQIISWHEAHHHGQAHITLNLFRNK